MSIRANLKKYFLSPWLYILLVPELVISFILYIDHSTVNRFVNTLLIINVYLTVFIGIFSVYAIHGIKEIEWSIKSRAAVILKTMVSSAVFCFSSLVIPFVFIALDCIQKGVSFEIAANYILYFLFVTAAQIIFLLALGFFLGAVIKNIAAYACVVLASMPFTPFFQAFLVELYSPHSYKDTGEFSRIIAFTNLINLSLDDPDRTEFAGYGMPIDTENILSWIITVLCGLFLIFLVFAGKRCFRLRGTAAMCVLSLLVVFSGMRCTELYFEMSPIINVYNYTYSDRPPVKIDTSHIYADDNSPIVTRYDMKLDTGAVLKNQCELSLNVNNNSDVRLRLDECFEIHSLTVDGENTDYTKEGDYFTVKLNPSRETSVIKIEYSGRLSYTDMIHNKVDCCDINGGFLSGMFSWYPKLLSAENVSQSKDFTVEIDAVNRFVTNLDGYTVHPSGKQTVSGKKQDILFYLGFISEVDKDCTNGVKVILPTEYENNEEAITHCFLYSDYGGIKEHGGRTYKNYFLRYDGPEWDDNKKTDTTLISFEEHKALINDWLDTMEADREERNNIADIEAKLEGLWDDSLIEKRLDPAYLSSEECITINSLSSALHEIWERKIRYISSEELSKINTMIVIPHSYNLADDAYIFEDCIIATEGCAA